MTDMLEKVARIIKPWAWEKTKHFHTHYRWSHRQESLETAEAVFNAIGESYVVVPRELFESIKWKSADKDNMEFSARITCWQMDKLHVLSASKETSDG